MKATIVIEQYLLPLIGVILGWLLSSISSAIRKKHEYKIILGKGVTQLTILHNDLSETIQALERYKDDVNTWKDYELIRNRIMGKHFDTDGEILKKIDEIFTKISGVDPVLALYILSLKKGLLESKSTPMDKVCENEKIYVKLISAQETNLILTCKELERIIKKLSFKHSPITYLKIRKFIKIRNDAELAADLFDFPRLKDLKIPQKESYITK